VAGGPDPRIPVASYAPALFAAATVTTRRLQYATSVVDDEVFVLASVADVLVAENRGENFSELVSLDLHGRLGEVGQHADMHLIERQQRRGELQHHVNATLSSDTHTATQSLLLVTATETTHHTV